MSENMRKQGSIRKWGRNDGVTFNTCLHLDGLERFRCADEAGPSRERHHTARLFQPEVARNARHAKGARAVVAVDQIAAVPAPAAVDLVAVVFGHQKFAGLVARQAAAADGNVQERVDTALLGLPLLGHFAQRATVARRARHLRLRLLTRRRR